ncbi:MAG TPA: bifunctional hydroxymethylpyrimidine kinase/phosphomethylpyrimidine kinase [Vicinamibacterales bacterium]|nr:bifunctional hydroxymethylpyrimidine kinase/phosphomethylpyrimidine kinase [Vicinamibacterales bacterium]
MPIALTIAGSDPTGGAGLQADLKTFAAHGVYGLAVVTAVTVQNTLGVDDAFAVTADRVTAQVEALAGDFAIDAVKIGMLANGAIVEAVAALIATLDPPNVVLDPVLASAGGRPLLDADGILTMVRELLPRTLVVTPNVPEAETLASVRIRSVDDMKTAAERIHRLGARAVVIKGGHLPGARLVNVLFDGRRAIEIAGPRVDGSAHGTGCAFSAALAAGLAHGRALAEAVEAAGHYVAGALRHRLPLGHGAPLLDHFWQTREREIL